MKQLSIKHNKTIKLTLAAFFFALGLVLPFITGQIPQIGSMLLPMHLPVLLCGIICGWQYGGIVGFTLPFVRFFLFGMPPLFPTGVAMAFELATYGIVIALLYERFPKKIQYTYASLISAMLVGRVVWGIVRTLISGASGNPFTWQLFMSGAFLTAIPGIILQLILIPTVIVALTKVGIFNEEQPDLKTI